MSICDHLILLSDIFDDAQASVNVVKWGGGGTGGFGLKRGVLYTASSDRTVRVWDAEGVSIAFYTSSTSELNLFRAANFTSSKTTPTG